MRPQIDAAIAHQHALGCEVTHLLAEAAATGRERDAAVGTQHPEPWQLDVIGRLAQHATNQARTPGQAGTVGNLAIARDTTAGNRCDRVQYRHVFRRTFGTD